MNILVYEYITGGGLLPADDSLLSSLRPEGEAMLRAVVADFAALPDTQVTVLRDARLPWDFEDACEVHWVDTLGQDAQRLSELAAKADHTLLIAPEMEGALITRARRVVESGGRLLSPGPSFIAAAADKYLTFEALRRAGLRVPETRRIDAADGVLKLPESFPYPAVVKRVDGAGSLGMRRISCPGPVSLDATMPWLLQELRPGIPVSVSFLCGPRECVALAPFRQRISDESFRYLGGLRLTDKDLVGRSSCLASAALEALGQPMGYVGVDLILGEHAGGEEDYVLEVNPRLTTSYVGHRFATSSNLAAAMLAAAAGEAVSLSWNDDLIEFDASGSVVTR